MIRIRLYLGSQKLENYLNRKAEHNYALESIMPFGLFQPLRLDVYKFIKINQLNRLYIVDSNDIKKIKEVYQKDAWQYFKNNYANDEFNNDSIFYRDGRSKDMIMDKKAASVRHQNDISSSLVKGLFLSIVFLGFSIVFPGVMNHSNKSFIGFVLSNIYILVAVILVIISLLKYRRSCKCK